VSECVCVCVTDARDGWLDAARVWPAEVSVHMSPRPAAMPVAWRLASSRSRSSSSGQPGTYPNARMQCMARDHTQSACSHAADAASPTRWFD
jgi:hypothetical protein